MADPVKTSSETPNQPAVETPAAAAASTPVAAAVTPTDPAPAAPATDKTPPAAIAATPPATDPVKPAVEPVKAAEPAKPADVPATGIQADVKYEIKAPDGMQIDPELVPALTPALKAAGLTNAQLQTVAVSFLEFQKGIAPRMLARDLEITSKDKELGGARLGQTQKEVALAIQAFGDPEFRKFVDQAGIGNRLEFVRFAQRIGEAMAKAGDIPFRGEPDAAPETTRAQRMYGGSKKT